MGMGFWELPLVSCTATRQQVRGLDRLAFSAPKFSALKGGLDSLTFSAAKFSAPKRGLDSLTFSAPKFSASKRGLDSLTFSAPKFSSPNRVLDSLTFSARLSPVLLGVGVGVRGPRSAALFSSKVDGFVPRTQHVNLRNVGAPTSRLRG